MAIDTMALAELADVGAFISLMTKEIFGLTAPRVFCKTYQITGKTFNKFKR